MASYERGGRVGVDDPSVIDDGDAVAEALRLLHQVRREQHGLAAIADAPHEIPDCAARLRIQTGRELVEEHELGIVDEGERDEQPLLLPARERHEPGLPLVAEAELLEQPPAVDGSGIERRPESDRLLYFDPLLQLRFLQLHADSLLQAAHVTKRIEPEHRNLSGIRRPQPFDALQRGGLAGAVWANQAEDFPRLDLERHVVDGQRGPIGFADVRDADRGLRAHDGLVARAAALSPRA